MRARFVPASTVYPTATPEEQKYHIQTQSHIQTGEPVYTRFEQPIMFQPSSAYTPPEQVFYTPIVETNEAPTSDTNYSIFQPNEEDDSNNYFNVFGFTNGMSDQPF